MSAKVKCDFCDELKSHDQVARVEFGIVYHECSECAQKYYDNPDAIWDDAVDFALEKIEVAGINHA